MPQARIVPHLWFDKEAKEAAKFYTSLFPDSKITKVTTIRDTPSGEVDTVAFELAKQPFLAISAGPLFKFNPAISFLLNFDPSRDKRAQQNLDKTWAQLAQGGTALMELGEYPFSKRYGWIQDRYGVCWQLMLTDPKGEPRPFITPFLLFVGPVCGKAEEATEHYLSIFKNARRGTLARHPKGSEPDREGTVLFTDIQLDGTWFAAMDSAHDHKFAFNEAISLMVYCDDQKEIDHYWKHLSAVPAAEQCGWLKDRYGVSWQVVPRAMDRMMRTGSREQIARVTQAFLPMKKFDLASLEKAFAGPKTSRTRAKKRPVTKVTRAQGDSRTRPTGRVKRVARRPGRRTAKARR